MRRLAAGQAAPRAMVYVGVLQPSVTVPTMTRDTQTPSTEIQEDRFGAVKGATLAVGVGLAFWLLVAWLWLD